jgi:plasmid stabilization system protein ParE
MTRTLIYRPEALVDLDQTEAYTRRAWGDQQAKTYIATLVADIKGLREAALRQPLIGAILPGLRRKRSGMHHIYYLAHDNSVEILAVIHVQRDPGLHLKSESWPGEANSEG